MRNCIGSEDNGLGNGSGFLQNNIAPQILEELRHLDLSTRADFKKSKVVGGGAYGDIMQYHCLVTGQGRVKVAVKRLRFYLFEEIKLVRSFCFCATSFNDAPRY